jgi:hypothetical protein
MASAMISRPCFRLTRSDSYGTNLPILSLELSVMQRLPSRPASAARAGLVWSRRAQDSMLTVIALQHLALVGVRRGASSTSAKLLGFVSRQFTIGGMDRGSTETWGYQRLMIALREVSAKPRSRRSRPKVRPGPKSKRSNKHYCCRTRHFADSIANKLRTFIGSSSIRLAFSKSRICHSSNRHKRFRRCCARHLVFTPDPLR